MFTKKPYPMRLLQNLQANLKGKLIGGYLTFKNDCLSNHSSKLLLFCSLFIKPSNFKYVRSFSIKCFSGTP